MFLTGKFTRGLARTRGPPAGRPHRRRSCAGASLATTPAPPLRRRPAVDQDMACGGFTATGTGERAVQLSGAHVGGTPLCRGDLSNDSGRLADNLQCQPWTSAGSPPPALADARSACRRPHRRPVRLHRGDPEQRLRPRPERRRPAGRPGHVPRRRVHRHRHWRGRRGPPAGRPHQRPVRLHRRRP